MIRIPVCAQSLALAVTCLSLTGCLNPLMKASERGDTAMVDKWTPLQLAAKWGQAEVVRILIRRGADVNARNFQNLTAIEIARMKGHENVVQAILEETGQSQAPPQPAPKARPVPTEPEPPPPAG